MKIGKIRAKIHEIGKKGYFWIGNDSPIRQLIWPNKITGYAQEFK